MEDGREMIKVLYEDNHLLCVEKPVNIPVQEDSSKDLDLLSACKQYLKEKYSKPGNVYLGLVHRLDRPVGGVMVFAKTSKAAGRLSESMRTDKFHKVYAAVLDGIPKETDGTLTDYLVKDTRTNTVTVTDKAHGKYCCLHYHVKHISKQRTLVRIELETGRSHQIRVQFACRHLPLVNDQRYNPHATGRGQIALWAVQLDFPHPITGENVHITSLPPHTEPWNGMEEYL